MTYDPATWSMANRTVDKRTTSRLILKRGRQRRTRERVVIAYCAEGWLANAGFPREQTCKSVFDLGADDYWAFHGEAHERHHVSWHVERHQGAWRYTSYYCDAHLPAEYRELWEAAR